MAGAERIDPERSIHQLRGVRVMIDSDLAALYGVTTGRLMEAVRRNRARFPSDFMFVLGSDDVLISQSAISSASTPEGSWGGRRKAVHAFTEQGIAMLSSVLRSERSIAVNIAIMRAFVELRRSALVDEELGRRLDALERSVQHERTIRDAQVGQIFEAIRELSIPPARPRGKFGFHADSREPDE